MKRAQLAALGASAALSVLTTLTPVAATAAVPDDERRYADYLPAAQVETTIVTNGQAQCGLPVRERKGPWTCLQAVSSAAPSPATPEESQPASSTTDPLALDGGAEEAPVVALAAGTDCNAHGACWNQFTNWKSTNTVEGAFGVNSDVIGEAYMYSSNHLNGAQMRTVTYWQANVSTADLVAEGDLFYGDQDTQGKVLDGQYDLKTDSGQAAGNRWWPWGGSGGSSTAGYKSYNTTRGNHANVIQYTWGKGAYPGHTWWMFMKSQIAQDHDNNNLYAFLDPAYRFARSEDIGHRVG